MTLVAGVDSSTQSCKVVVCDADTGMIVREGKAAHPAGTEVNPEHWWTALEDAIRGAGGLDDVDAVSVSGQQHGLICLDRNGQVIRDALLWNDTRSAACAAALVDELGADEWAARVGVVPVAAITAAKLRWVADHEPDVADTTAAVCLPHDWLTWRLRGADGIGTLTTDRSDASGTGYFAAAGGSYQPDLLELAFRGRRPVLPTVLEPDASAGRTSSGCLLGVGAGDNASAALGLAAGLGDCIVSLGTSGVVSVITDTPPRDGSGLVAGFADATGRQLPLVCTLNGAPVLASTAGMLGVDLDEFGRLALTAEPGAGGLVMVPYLSGERSPNIPDATGSIVGITGDNWTPANVARASVEGLLCSLAYCLDLIGEQGIGIDRIVMVGGGVRSAAVLAVAPGLFGRAVTVPAAGEYVARGAARQAAWALTGQLPTWDLAAEHHHGTPTDSGLGADVYRRYLSATGLVLSR